MTQSLLADRFQMKAHFETREMPVYELVLAEGGPKLKEADPAKHDFRTSKGFTGSATVQDLIDFLECAPDIGGQEVVDKTGLTGLYDISLRVGRRNRARQLTGAEVEARPRPMWKAHCCSRRLRSSLD